MDKLKQDVVIQKPKQMKYPIGGVSVLIPVKPYPSQLAMMGQIIRGLKSRENCLLESPTGSGKSLALLCSTLAWQREQREKAKRYNQLIDCGVTDKDVLARAAGLPNLPPRPMPGCAQGPPATVPPPTPASNAQPLPSGAGFFYEEDDDFKTKPKPASQAEMGDPAGVPTEFIVEGQNAQQKPRKLGVPKVFIGTRTHKQVEQIIRELRRTDYNKVRMTVLSSREHTCIHPIVSTCSNKNEKCRELTDPLKGSLCSYHHGVNSIKTHDLLERYGGVQGAWDIEDIVKVGHKVHACPYYSARSLLSTAELVVCPYNYLIDPIIRESMNINLKNHVLILDEAHNIEDSARSAASRNIMQDELKEACKHLKERKSKEDECARLAEMLTTLSIWIDDNNHTLKDYTDFGKSGKMYTGTEIIAILDHLGIGRDAYSELEGCFRSLTEQIPEKEEEEPALNIVAKKVLEDIFLVFNFLFKDDMKHKDDYRVALEKEKTWKKSGLKVDGWISGKPTLREEYSLNFWCLNPAVAFSPISTVTHTIILTSGTLSPMNSFQSELGVSFKIQLEANHVIDHKQVFVGAIGHGPRGRPLVATYQNTDTWEFQDELGELLLNVCNTVPGGILCFFPSYALMEKLYDRWQNTGLWNQIQQTKKAMIEQKKGGDFERDLIDFYTTIKNVQMEGAGPINGVFFLAVYRGKVSEGLDFADDNARTVIAVGIPYPYVKNIQVKLKKQYNDMYHHSRKLLSGNEWYEIQAYRAVNQALGRCIRHRYDWGALLLVDQRYQYRTSRQGSRYISGLSKWVKNKVVYHDNFSFANNNLREFVNNMLTNPPQPPKTHDEMVLASSLESTSNENIETPPARESDRLKENFFHEQKEHRKKSPNNQEKSEQNFGSGSCEYSKENEKMFSQNKKRPATPIDYQDLDDFNLALSPRNPVAKKPSFDIRKKKKDVVFIDLD